MTFLDRLNEKVILLFVILLSMVQVLQPITEPDLGWHIAVGRLIVQESRLPVTEPFAFSTPGHLYVAHSWLQDVILYQVEELFGMWGITLWYALLFSGISIVIFYINKKSKIPTKLFFLIPLLVAFMIYYVNIRTHLISVLGLFIILYLDTLYPQLKNGTRYLFTFLLFFIWANFHGGVVLGLGLLLYLLFFRLYRERRSQLLREGVITFVLGVLGSLCNPYGYQIFLFAFTLGSSSVSQTFNQDWLPLLSTRLSVNTFIPRLLLVFITLWAGLNSKDRKFQILLFVSFILSLFSMRWILLLFVILLSLLLPLISTLLVKKNKYLDLIVVSGIVLSIVMPLTFLKKTWCVNTSPKCYAQVGGYPYESVQELKKLSSIKRIFNHYNWGGYILWQVPHQTIFIDGRMDNYNQGQLLQDFADIESRNENWKTLFEELDSDLVLLPTDWKITKEIEKDYQHTIISKTKTATLLAVD